MPKLRTELLVTFALGTTLMALSLVGNIWMFLVGNWAAGIVARIVFRTLHPQDA